MSFQVDERRAGSRRIRLTIAYDGTGYHGWQRQRSQRSVQESIECALEGLHGHPVALVGAGRTDAGVHARGQVAHFDTSIDSIPEDRFPLALNRLLPRDIRILRSELVPIRFHARHDATERIYHYQLQTMAAPSPMDSRYYWLLNHQPSLMVLNELAGSIVGTHDFTAFSTAGDPSPSREKTISSSCFFPTHSGIVYRIVGRSFLWKMVRSLVGTMIELEHSAGAVVQMRRILDGRERSMAGTTAPAVGLFLEGVRYGG